jgi:hypothetical protein
MTTVTHIAKPIDSRCQWWQAEITPACLDVKFLEEKAPFKYFKKDSDLELAPGTLLIDSEQTHHRKMRGYTVNLGLVFEDGVKWLKPKLEHKKYIKELGHQDLMKGSGDVAATLRIAIYLSKNTDKFAEFLKLKDM